MGSEMCIRDSTLNLWLFLTFFLLESTFYTTNVEVNVEESLLYMYIFLAPVNSDNILYTYEREETNFT